MRKDITISFNYNHRKTSFSVEPKLYKFSLYRYPFISFRFLCFWFRHDWNLLGLNN